MYIVTSKKRKKVIVRKFKSLKRAQNCAEIDDGLFGWKTTIETVKDENDTQKI